MSGAWTLDVDADRIGTLWLDVPEEKVNTLSTKVMEELRGLLETVDAESAGRGGTPGRPPARPGARQVGGDERREAEDRDGGHAGSVYRIDPPSLPRPRSRCPWSGG